MSSARVLPDATTDHYPVQVDVQLERTRRAATRVTRTERDFRGLDKDALVLGLLYHDFTPLMLCGEPNEASFLLQEGLEEALNVAAPSRTFITPYINVRLRPDTRATMRAQDRAKREG